MSGLYAAVMETSLQIRPGSRKRYVLLGIVGAIADGTTSSLVASGARWKSLVSVGMLMGVIGGVCGNYVGIAVAYLIRMITGA